MAGEVQRDSSLSIQTAVNSAISRTSLRIPYSTQGLGKITAFQQDWRGSSVIGQSSRKGRRTDRIPMYGRSCYGARQAVRRSMLCL